MVVQLVASWVASMACERVGMKADCWVEAMDDKVVEYWVVLMVEKLDD